ncbi:MAG TPA: PGPGW domain-containing protein [Phycisphaerae bacterium]|jgi:hypothetical protein|nr:hypothetical protein [Phycisphaerae bacterium]HOB73510.1 PGPGW domain-containing protein [Phycisphaerae bacterium]HOJ54118.1 PGPGW domain-containing protein [Phycisphaerae bacterium]HOL25589.1 PGPGW domain-containing protein [Phycisphaerae bacterium]HPP20978.1 PGPGW domain-containing protein [Phycisphaerae bacterium]
MFWTWKTARRAVVAVIGGTVVLIGVVFLVTPGPGIGAIVLGLAILATEFVWAQRLLTRVKHRARTTATSLGWGRSAADVQTNPPAEAQPDQPPPPCSNPSPEVRHEVPTAIADGHLPAGLVDSIQQPPSSPPDEV